MDVYIEITYLINAFLILLTFEILCFLLNIQMTKKELFRYMITYNLSILFLYIDFFDGFLLLYNLLITIYYFRRLTYVYYPIYLFVYISLLSFLEFVLPYSTIFQCVLVIDGVNGVSLIILGMFYAVIAYFYISFCNYRLNQRDMVDVCIHDKNILGFIDNGNKVFYKGYPVIFVAEHLLNEDQIIDTIQITTASTNEKIGIVELYDIEINHQRYTHIYAGVLKTCEYDCILNTQLMGGLL